MARLDNLKRNVKKYRDSHRVGYLRISIKDAQAIANRNFTEFVKGCPLNPSPLWASAVNGNTDSFLARRAVEVLKDRDEVTIKDIRETMYG